MKVIVLFASTFFYFYFLACFPIKMKKKHETVFFISSLEYLVIEIDIIRNFSSKTFFKNFYINLCLIFVKQVVNINNPMT